jgi:hypothetical protein
MRKIIFLIVILFSAFVGISHAGTFHIFIIDQKQTFNVDGTDYDAWVLSSGENTRYYMLPSDPRPEGRNVHNVIAKLASSGVNDMLYIFERSLAAAEVMTVLDEYAGGGNTYGNAWIDFIVKSFLRLGAHSAFPAGAAAKLTLLTRWKVDGEWVSGTLGDWIDAGEPMDSAHTNVGHRVFGVD